MREWVEGTDARSRPVIVITGRGRPHLIATVGISLVAGGAYTAGATTPTSMGGQPGWLVSVWAGLLFVSGVVGAAALLGWRRHPERSLRVEGGAMLVGAAGLIMSAAATFSYASATGPVSRALLSGGTALFLAGANLWRAWQCRRDAHRVAGAGAGDG